MIKRFIKTGLFFLGILCIPAVNAALISHRLDYTNTDNDGTAQLYANITFDTGDPAAQSNTGAFDDLDTDFITSITFVYTPVPEGASFTISGSDITKYRLTKKNASVDYDGNPSLLTQFDNLQFGTFGASGNSFSLSMNDTPFKLDADNSSGQDNDFLLTSTTRFPAPLPLLGILPAITSIRKLKKRYNSRVNN